MKTDILTKLEDSDVQHMDVTLEAYRFPGPGWAVFGESEGDSPTLRAFVDDKALASALLAAKVEDGDESVNAVFDGSMVPAFMLPDGRLLIANDYRDKEAIAALADVTGADPKAWGEVG